MTTQASTGTAPSKTRPGVAGAVEARAARFFDLLNRLHGDDDVELIHDIRVFSRRLGEGLGVMRPVLPTDPVAALRAWLSETRNLLAPARDADVMLKVLRDLMGGKRKLAALPAGAALVEALRLRRRHHLTDARVQLDPARAQARHESLLGMLTGATSNAVSDEALERDLSYRLRRRVRRRRRDFYEAAGLAAKSHKAAQLHAARIAGKKIRYALELADESKVLDAAREIKWLRRVQDSLGDLNDLAVLRAQMAAFSEHAEAEQRVGVDKILSRVKRRHQGLVKRFAKDWPKMRRSLRSAKARKVKT